MGKYDALMSYNKSKYADLMSYGGGAAAIATPQEAPPPEQKNFLEKAVGYVVDPIKEMASGISQDIQSQGEKIAEREAGGSPGALATTAGLMRFSSDIFGRANKTINEYTEPLESIAPFARSLPIAGPFLSALQTKKDVGALAEKASPIIAPVAEKVGGAYERYLPAPVKDIAETVVNSPVGIGELALASKGGLTALRKGISKVSGVKKSLSPVVAFERAVEKGVSKGIKPTVIGKPSLSRMEKFYDDAKDAVETIAANRKNLNLVDEVGEAIPFPKTSGQMAQAIDQTKKQLYKQYHDMALAAGDVGAKFDTKKILNKLDEVSTSKKYDPNVRDYAETMKATIGELAGEAPEVIEARIADLNNSLVGFYEGRVGKAKAQVDASIANLMREELDNKITSAVGKGYQGLKNQYGSLKAIEKEVNKRALVNARRASKNVADLTDIFTGGELITGVLTANPALIAKGVAGRGIKELYKSLNDPDRYIKDMFKKAYNVVEELPSDRLKAPNLDAPTFARKGIPIEQALRREAKTKADNIAANAAERAAIITEKEAGRESLLTGIRGLRPQLLPDQEYRQILRDYYSGRSK